MELYCTFLIDWTAAGPVRRQTFVQLINMHPHLSFSSLRGLVMEAGVFRLQLTAATRAAACNRQFYLLGQAQSFSLRIEKSLVSWPQKEIWDVGGNSAAAFRLSWTKLAKVLCLSRSRLDAKKKLKFIQRLALTMKLFPTPKFPNWACLRLPLSRFVGLEHMSEAKKTAHNKEAVY